MWEPGGFEFMSSEDKRPLGLLHVVGSVLSSFLGVQSGKNRERDFTHGRPRDFILVAVVLTLLFVLVVWGIVKLVVSVAGV
jgi:hypothetical protein